MGAAAISRWLALTSSIVIVSGCGDSTVGPAGAASGASSADPSLLVAGGVVLDDDSRGPRLCLGGVLDSYVPQCGGVRLAGWDWAEAGQFEESGTAKWGYYVVVGTWAPETEVFTVARPPLDEDEVDVEPAVLAGLPTDDRTTPCAEPEGGWTLSDPARATWDSKNDAMDVARGLPDFGEVWLDRHSEPVTDGLEPAEAEVLYNDSSYYVLNVSVTRDVAGAEAALREVWGGSLCVSEARHSAAELAGVREEVSDLPGVLAANEARDGLYVNVYFDDGSLQSALDDKYGSGVVQVVSFMQPYRG